MSAFLRLLWSGRDRRRPNPSHQERIVQAAQYPRHRNVQAAPVRPPLKEKRGA
jgi:hypothetical protein